jgi:acyl-CoA synthetase (AMP-forming)/AMP-acid ligase II
MTTPQNTAACVFERSAEKWADRPFLCVGPLTTRSYLPEGWEITYGEAAKVVADLRRRYARAGYGFGHRVAILLENRPDFHLHFLALNGLGTSIVPLNPDYRPDESRYAIEHSEACLIVALPEREKAIAELAATCAQKPAVVAIGSDFAPSPAPLKPPLPGEIGLRSEASLLYTSGTTGRPKGCVIPNEYYRKVGLFYTEMGGLATLRDGVERVFNPLPLFHMNAGVTSFMGMILKGGCSILPDRFHPGSWWREIIDSRATVAHYLGVVPAMLMKASPAPDDRAHGLKFCVGAGVEPELHEPFEKRFGVPLIELWGMTETGGGFIASEEPRMIHTRAFGRPLGRPGLDLDVRIVDSDDRDVAVGQQGELLVRRHGTEDPRVGFFVEYLKNPQPTADAWRGGWFHTGDVVRQDETGMLFFVDRNKNIIRRSGENIAAAEVEATLLGHEAVAEVAVMAAADEVREEEVMACIVPRAGFAAGNALARSIFDFANEKLAYYKPPGWIVFIDKLPKTSTQKVQKTEIFPKNVDPKSLPDAFDLRSLKKRGSPT